MRKYSFATARNGRTKRWKHRELSFTEVQKYLLKERILETTVKEYEAMDADGKATLKNGNPSFIGGFFEGRRTSVTIENRSIIALDIDKPFPIDFKDFMASNSEYPYHIYESVSSTPKHRKYRLLFFLNEDLNADHYEPVARRIAQNLNIIDYVDHTCYRKTQIMYAPVYLSGMVDPVNQFVGNTKEPNISTNELLASFAHDINDVAFWDSAVGEGALRQQNRMTLSDPREKNGLIGIFCRYVGDVQTAIEQYGLPYKRETETRYSFTGGSSRQGFVIYDEGQWGYSNHESDPASEGGHDLNAFDLVRIHLYGHLDRKPTYADPTKAPSFKALNAFLMEDEGFRSTLDESRVGKAFDRINQNFSIDDDFSDVLDGVPEVKKNRIIVNGKSIRYDPATDKKLLNKLRRFEAKLDKSKDSGIPLSSKTNAYNAIREHPLLKGRILFDTFTRRMVFAGKRPWRVTEGEAWNENDTFMLSTFLESHDLSLPNETVKQASIQIAQEEENSYNSLAHYFKHELPAWDGRKRVETIFTDAFDADNSVVNKMIARKFFLAGLERALSDGPSEVKAIPVLQGPQSCGKSSFWRLLACKREWFNDSKIDIGNKDGLSILGGSFIIEFAEFASIKKADRDEVKQFLSGSVDKYRPPYGMTERSFVRHNIFVGSVNDEEFLTDPTGNTRYKVVHCPGDFTGAKRVYDLLTPDYVQQLWAEALVMRENGLTHLYDADEDGVTETETSKYVKSLGFEDLIHAFVSFNKPEEWLLYSNDPQMQNEILKSLVKGRYEDAELTVEREDRFTLRELREALLIRDYEEARYRGQIASVLGSIQNLEKARWRKNGFVVNGYRFKTED